MEYLLIFILQAFGVAFNAYRKIMELDKQFQDVPLSEIKNKFLKNERITFLGSSIIVLFHLLCHVIIELYFPQLRKVEIPLFITDWSIPYVIASFIIAFVLGYSGQWLVYRVFGKAEKYLASKTE